MSCSPDPIIGFTLDGEITEWNPAAERLYGYSRGGGRRAQRRSHRAAGAVVGRPLRPGRRGRDDQRLRHPARVTRSGARIDVSISMSPIIDDHGAVVGVAAFSRATSARACARGARCARSEMLLAEAAGAGVGWAAGSGISPPTRCSGRRGCFASSGSIPTRSRRASSVYFARFHPDDRSSGGDADSPTMVATGRVVLHTRACSAATGRTHHAVARPFDDATPPATPCGCAARRRTSSLLARAPSARRRQPAQRGAAELRRRRHLRHRPLRHDDVRQSGGGAAHRLRRRGHGRAQPARHASVTRAPTARPTAPRLPGVGVAAGRHRAPLRHRRVLAQGRLELSGRVHEHADPRGRAPCRRRRRRLQGHQRAPRARARARTTSSPRSPTSCAPR